MMHDALRLLRKEHKLQADVKRKTEETVVSFERKREGERRDKDREREGGREGERERGI